MGNLSTDIAIEECANVNYFADYMSKGFGSIEGWPGNKPSVQFNYEFRDLFAQFNETGGVCEIGVHHGKYLIALHNIFGDRRSLGLDLFDDQASNIDLSGKGDLEICRQNILEFAKNPELVSLEKKDSIAISSEDIQSIILNYGKFSIFSIDGGHTKMHITIDLDNAAKMTSETGIIVIDDIFHPDWPQVTEGIYQSISACRTPFVPFLVTRKKLYMCLASLQMRYAKFSAERRGQFTSKTVSFAGWQVPSINFGSEY